MKSIETQELFTHAIQSVIHCEGKLESCKIVLGSELVPVPRLPNKAYDKVLESFNSAEFAADPPLRGRRESRLRNASRRARERERADAARARQPLPTIPYPGPMPGGSAHPPGVPQSLVIGGDYDRLPAGVPGNFGDGVGTQFPEFPHELNPYNGGMGGIPGFPEDPFGGGRGGLGGGGAPGLGGGIGPGLGRGGPGFLGQGRGRGGGRGRGSGSLGGGSRGNPFARFGPSDFA